MNARNVTQPPIFWAFSLAEFLGLEPPENCAAADLLSSNKKPTEGEAGAAIEGASRFLGDLENVIKADPRRAAEWLEKFAVPGLWVNVLLATSCPLPINQKTGEVDHENS